MSQTLGLALIKDVIPIMLAEMKIATELFMITIPCLFSLTSPTKAASDCENVIDNLLVAMEEMSRSFSLYYPLNTIKSIISR